MMDLNNASLLARAAVEDVAAAIAPGSETWQRDVLGRSVDIGRPSLLAFRLRGHTWSVVLGDDMGKVPFLNESHDWEKRLSLRLGAPVISYWISDTGGGIGYTLVEGGEVVEDFQQTSPENAPDPEWDTFVSTRRSVSLADIEHSFRFVHRTFVDLDAFDPGFEFDHFFDRGPGEPGELRAVVNPGLVRLDPLGGNAQSLPEIERVDYLTFKAESRRRPEREIVPAPPG
jgi:hypothetical protein